MRKTKLRARTVLPFTDFEQLGYETALQSRDQVADEQICALHMHLGRTSTRRFLIWTVGSIQIGTALAPFIRTFDDRPVPAGDVAMLARDHAVPLLVILGAIAGIAPIISYGMTFYLIGRGVWLS